MATQTARRLRPGFIVCGDKRERERSRRHWGTHDVRSQKCRGYRRTGVRRLLVPGGLQQRFRFGSTRKRRANVCPERVGIRDVLGLAHTDKLAGGRGIRQQPNRGGTSPAPTAKANADASRTTAASSA